MFKKSKEIVHLVDAMGLMSRMFDEVQRCNQALREQNSQLHDRVMALTKPEALLTVTQSASALRPTIQPNIADVMSEPNVERPGTQVG